MRDNAMSVCRITLIRHMSVNVNQKERATPHYPFTMILINTNYKSDIQREPNECVLSFALVLQQPKV